jgi:hypothetical protein
MMVEVCWWWVHRLIAAEALHAYLSVNHVVGAKYTAQKRQHKYTTLTVSK